MTRVRWWPRRLGASILAGALAGVVVLGLLGRAVMRLVGEIAGLPTGGTLGGTLEVIATGALMGAVAGPVYLLVQSRLPGPAPLRGLAFGLGAFLLLLAFPPEAARSAATGTRHVQGAVVACFAALFAVFGIGLEVAFRKLGLAPGAR
jgi:hypothetical protein